MFPPRNHCGAGANMPSKLNLGAALAMLFLAPAAAAQDVTARPLSGSIRLSVDFLPDPHSVSLTSGGPNPASRLGSGCAGYVSSAPNVEVTYTAGSAPLLFRTVTEGDTTLVINGPDGRWYCDDDGYEDGDAQVRFADPRSGTYDVWIGSYASGGTASATLLITEMDDSVEFDPSGPSLFSSSSAVLDPSETAPSGEVSLISGFRPDPLRVAIRAGGTIQASTVSPGCNGVVASHPDYEVTYTAGPAPLVFRTSASADTTLVISGPRGEWVCDDDSGPEHDAEVIFDKPESGVYDVWVGTYGGGTWPAYLIVTGASRRSE